MSQLGLRADFHWRLGSTTLVPELTLAWEHEYDNFGGRSIDPTLSPVISLLWMDPPWDRMVSLQTLG